MEKKNYLDEVVQQQNRVENELRRRKQAPTTPEEEVVAEHNFPSPRSSFLQPAVVQVATSEDYRITGWLWKTVVVAPNVYVVHTRRGHAEPLTCGLGISFHYNPYTDAFLTIPAAVQTLLINARCISSERQGVLVQAYVQWVVDDLRTAYRRLDFSDRTDPMRVVNVQLREQAEAAIKDKVAMMPIDAILSDKQPIIEELTHRLRSVAESREGQSSGLGLKIVTVQIKEAVVSSTTLWENLQKPFRAEREKLARMAELEAKEVVARRELAYRQERTIAEMLSAREVAEMQAKQQRETFDREQAENLRRKQAEDEFAAKMHEVEAVQQKRQLESIGRTLELEKVEAELERYRQDTTIEKDNREHEAYLSREQRSIQLAKEKRGVENDLSETLLKSQMIATLPQIAQAMPQPTESRTVTIAGEGATAVGGLVAGLMQVIEASTKNGKS